MNFVLQVKPVKWPNQVCMYNLHFLMSVVLADTLQSDKVDGGRTQRERGGRVF